MSQTPNSPNLANQRKFATSKFAPSAFGKQNETALDEDDLDDF